MDARTREHLVSKMGQLLVANAELAGQVEILVQDLVATRKRVEELEVQLTAPRLPIEEVKSPAPPSSKKGVH